MDDFRKSVLKVHGPRRHKVNRSLGVYDAYKYLRKNKWKGIGHKLTEHQFYYIIRKINDCLAYNILNGEEITLPNRMGSLELRKYEAKLYLENGVVRTTLPIDWDRTLKLWAEDKESFDNKMLVRTEDKEIFKVFYNKKSANFNNKSFYRFEINRDIKRGLAQKIKDKAIDAYSL